MNFKLHEYKFENKRIMHDAKIQNAALEQKMKGTIFLGGGDCLEAGEGFEKDEGEKMIRQ